MYKLLALFLIAAITGCNAVLVSKEGQMASSGPVGYNDVCTFGGVDNEANLHCAMRMHPVYGVKGIYRQLREEDFRRCYEEDICREGIDYSDTDTFDTGMY